MTRENEILEDLKRRKRSFEIDGQPHWVVEGDLVLSEFRLRLYAADKAAEEAVSTGERKRGLVVVSRDERIVRWAPGKVLTYSIVCETFRDQAAYDRAKNDMRSASADWSAVCGVAFRHDPTYDQADEIPDDAVVFRVRQVPGGGGTIASAFFPHYAREERWVSLYDSYFDPNLSFDATGVLRHELGHVLGFRHEHIRDGAPMDCPDEPMADTRALTDYDGESVMHYFCGGQGSAKLAITELDKQGAQAVYGPPLSDFEFID